MTKKEIVKQISERAKLTQLQTKEIVQWTFDAIIDTLISEGRIELRNFGVFEVKRRKARKARNPRTPTRWRPAPTRRTELSRSCRRNRFEVLQRCRRYCL